jgi:hypothetical protein
MGRHISRGVAGPGFDSQLGNGSLGLSFYIFSPSVRCGVQHRNLVRLFIGRPIRDVEFLMY